MGGRDKESREEKGARGGRWGFGGGGARWGCGSAYDLAPFQVSGDGAIEGVRDKIHFTAAAGCPSNWSTSSPPPPSSPLHRNGVLCLLRRIFSGGITNYKPRRWGRSCGQGQGATHHSMGIGMGLETGWSSSLAHAPPHRHSRREDGAESPPHMFTSLRPTFVPTLPHSYHQDSISRCPPPHTCLSPPSTLPPPSTQLPPGQDLLLPHVQRLHARQGERAAGRGWDEGGATGGCEPAGFNRA